MEPDDAEAFQDRIWRLERDKRDLEKLVESLDSMLGECKERAARLDESVDDLLAENGLLKEEKALLLKDHRRLEFQVGEEGRAGWERAFRTLDPVFRRIEAALHAKDSKDFMPLILAALEEYAHFAPPFVLSERDYLSAIETAHVLRIGRDRLRGIPGRDLEYTVQGEGKSKQHRRYRREDVLRYAARLQRAKKARDK